MKLERKVQLISYPDSLGGNLAELNRLLDTKLSGLFPGGIHILPPFPSSGDRGFAPLTYLEIEPQFGNWEDIRSIAEKQPLILDLMVNHISAQSEYFQDFLSKGNQSQFADLFITLDKLWPDEQPFEEDINKIFLRRELPYSEYETSAGSLKVWTTFGKTNPSEQIDLDIHSAQTRDLFSTYLKSFHKNKVRIVRLDAVGYVIKKMGTSCFFVEPEIYEFLDWINQEANALGITLLPEIHADPAIQYKLAERGYWIYDFILPYTLLNAYINRTSKALKSYLQTRPHNQFTMLDCHDGIPIKPDLNGLYEYAEAAKLVETCIERGGNLSLIVSPEHQDPNGFDVHQIRGTLYSLMDCNDDAYLGARALQLFTPGIPQIYYVGLLAGENDVLAVQKTGEGRELNRHNYTLAEINQAIEKPVVQKLFRLIHLRNTHPAFDGEFSVNPSDDSSISLEWKQDNNFARLEIDFDSTGYKLVYNKPDISSTIDFS